MIALQEDPVSEGPYEALKPRIRTPVLDLAPDHFRVLDKAMSKFISSELAFETYAQIIDGAPLASAYRDWINMCRADFDENIESSLEAREMTRALQQNFDVRTLLVDARVKAPILYARNFLANQADLGCTGIPERPRAFARIQPASTRDRRCAMP